MKRRYYSVRTGKNPNSANIDLDTLKSLFHALYLNWANEGLFQEHFGYSCVDAGDVAGALGPDIEAAVLFHLRKENLWPIQSRLSSYTEDDLFDMLEFLHDHISMPTDGYHHTFAQCGWHYYAFDTAAGQIEFRTKIGDILESYKSGYEISPTGEILELAQPGTTPLLVAELPIKDANIQGRVNGAISKFRRYRSTASERREAVRDLADVLEYLRPQLKEVLAKTDENDLFNIANNFGIRHHNQQQKTDYDASIWLSWMFYFYLSTIHASLHMLKKKDAT